MFFKGKIFIPVICLFAILSLSASMILNSAGTFAGSGSPADGGTAFGTCGISGCHSGGATTPTLTLTSSPAFGTGNTYVPWQTYTITITPGGNYPRYGTNCEIINSQNANPSTVQMFGTLGTALNTSTQIYSAVTTAPYPPCISHTSTSGTGAFLFTWTAPANGTGYIYATVNGVNGDAHVTGDHVSSVTTMTLTPTQVGIESYKDNAFSLKISPNPASDNIRINYSLAERGNVSVNLFSLNGELKAHLIDEIQDKGDQLREIHLPVDLTSGVYIVKLSVNGISSEQRLLVL